MRREYYSGTLNEFLQKSKEEILGHLVSQNQFSLETTQRDTWSYQIDLLKKVLLPYSSKGSIFFEYSIPRMGQRIDVVLIIGPVIFVLEFKVGEKNFNNYAIEQVWDYALDLKNFHESSHNHYVSPILIATHAENNLTFVTTTPKDDKLLNPIKVNSAALGNAIESVLLFADGDIINHNYWQNGRYCPTPTIIEAAMALYNGHSVENISRSDAKAVNLRITSDIVSEIIKNSREKSRKSICFVTGVPGAGKTLVGLDIANKHSEPSDKLYSVYLSGNGPLVKILHEALIRDKIQKSREQGLKVKRSDVSGPIRARIQNVHHFRDDCLTDSSPPIEHVALFDEAQRAWDLQQTSSFMKRKKRVLEFDMSEPEFLISCLDRHDDWAVIVCLVGGGQEINTGEAGIQEWLRALQTKFPDWYIYLSPRLTDNEYGSGKILNGLKNSSNINYKEQLHLKVSMRSFRAENVSLLIKQVLDLDNENAKETLRNLNKYPIVLTRDIKLAKKWLKEQARGSERYGIVVSSQAERLRPHAIHVRSPIDPIHWFLNDKDDVRSSFYLEDVATEFHVQGLELDWACVVWDADFRYKNNHWSHWSFRGKKWCNILKPERQKYLKNAYRVLLTRARQGMIIVIPPGDEKDPTRKPNFYNNTFEYLKDIGFEVIK